MKDVYEKTIWENGKTYVTADNLNKIEDAIEDLYDTSISVSQLKGVNPVNVELAENQNVEVSVIPEELNKLVKHNIYKSGNGIFLTKEKKEFDLDNSTLEDFFPPEKPATVVSIDENYVNKIVEHPQLEEGNGILISVKEEVKETPSNDTELNENNDEDLEDEYTRPKQPTFILNADINYIDENITHPNYIGLKGIKIRKPNIEFVFPEGENHDDRTRVAYLDKDYINDKVIDFNKIAEKLHINPITEYVAGTGIILETEDNTTTDEENITENNESSSTIDTSNMTEEEKETYLDLMTPESEEEIKEATTIIKNVKLDEDYLKQTILDNLPTINVTDGLTIEITEPDETNLKTTHTISPDPEKLKELMNITPHSTITVDKGLELVINNPNEIDEIEEIEETEGEEKIYNPQPINYNITINPDDLKEVIEYEPNPIMKVAEGIDMTVTEEKDEKGEIHKVYNFALNADYINNIVIHKKYRFDGEWFKYSEGDDNVGLISLDKYKLSKFIKDTMGVEEE